MDDDKKNDDGTTEAAGCALAFAFVSLATAAAFIYRMLNELVATWVAQAFVAACGVALGGLCLYSFFELIDESKKDR